MPFPGPLTCLLSHHWLFYFYLCMYSPTPLLQLRCQWQFTVTMLKQLNLEVNDCNPAPFYLHHEDHRVERDHDKHCVLKGGRGHEMPQPILEGLPVLGHVAGHRLGADGEVNTGSLVEGGKSQIQDLRRIAERLPEQSLASSPAAAAAAYLVFLQTALVDHLVALLLEGDDDQSHKDVDEEEREDHKVDHVEDGHLHPVASTRPHVLLRDVGGVLKDPGKEEMETSWSSGLRRIFFKKIFLKTKLENVASWETDSLWPSLARRNSEESQ